MTISNPKTVVKALKAKGMLEDMQMVRIYQYSSINWDHSQGGIQFALFNESKWDDMDTSPYVANVVLLFDYPKVTAEGKAFLKSQGV
jgi:hypothetical protein